VLSRLRSDLEFASVYHNSLALSSVIIYGLGGSEKTLAPLEHLYRHYNAYSVILWPYADKNNKLDSQLAQLARLLGSWKYQQQPRSCVALDNSSQCVLLC
jgi:hypothetical protein